MIARSNLFTLSGLPDSFGVLLLGFALALLLAPYFAGVDFGVLKIPDLAPTLRGRLKVVGPLLFLSCVFAFVPIIPSKSKTCPQLAGTWERQKPADKLRVRIEQAGCTIQSTVTTVTMTERLEGRYIESEGYFEVTIDHLEGPSKDRMYGRLYPLSESEFKTLVYAKTGTGSPMIGPSDESFWTRL
jgi:hypothetical protein